MSVISQMVCGSIARGACAGSGGGGSGVGATGWSVASAAATGSGDAVFAVGQHDNPIGIAGAVFPFSSPFVMLARPGQLVAGDEQLVSQPLDLGRIGRENVVGAIHRHYIDSLGEGDLYQRAAHARQFATMKSIAFFHPGWKKPCAASESPRRR